jgi:hypothetical protein
VAVLVLVSVRMASLPKLNELLFSLGRRCDSLDETQRSLGFAPILYQPDAPAGAA